MQFKGVMPAITTPFNEDLTIDHGFIARHVNWLIDTTARVSSRWDHWERATH
jgi:dihydrodipicolinate synthase/N-acetylneuraminate lyase